jgi:putative alpha-1,2-mannosidase
LASPLWERAEVQLGNHRLSIVADNFAADHPYVQKVWLNDAVVDRTWLKHSEIAKGGLLRFEMGPQAASR